MPEELVDRVLRGALLTVAIGSTVALVVSLLVVGF